MVKPKQPPRATPRRNMGPRIGAAIAIALGVVVALGYFKGSSKMPPGDVEPGTPLPPAKPYTLGDSTAPVVVTEYADFECPGCGQFATLTEPDIKKRLIATGQVYYRYMDYPLPMHKNVWAASHAAHCAGEQGKFWEMHDRLFAGQDEWNELATRNPRNVLQSYATAIGINVSDWEKCYDEGRHRLQIAANRAAGDLAGVASTPTFQIGRRRVVGSIGYDQFKAYVDSALMEKGVTPAARP